MISSFPVNVIYHSATLQNRKDNQTQQSNQTSDICVNLLATENGYLPHLGLFFITTNAE